MIKFSLIYKIFKSFKLILTLEFTFKSNNLTFFIMFFKVLIKFSNEIK